MENLTVEDWKQLVIYYKNKVSELEFLSLLAQINNTKSIELEKENSNKLVKEKEAMLDYHLLDRDRTWDDKVKFLENEIDKKNKEIKKLKNNKI